MFAENFSATAGWMDSSEPTLPNASVWHPSAERQQGSGEINERKGATFFKLEGEDFSASHYKKLPTTSTRRDQLPPRSPYNTDTSNLRGLAASRSSSLHRITCTHELSTVMVLKWCPTMLRCMSSNIISDERGDTDVKVGNFLGPPLSRRNIPNKVQGRRSTA